MVSQLRFSLAKAICDERYFKLLVPFPWLTALEKLRTASSIGQGSLSISLKAVTELSEKCGVENEKVVPMLQLFNELGLLMHHVEQSLRHIVILDPATFLVEPAARIICQFDKHGTEKHNNARTIWKDDYSRLESTGRISRRLLKVLWDDIKPERQNDLERIMVRHGLIVPLLKDLDDNMDLRQESSDCYEYLVPTLLPSLKVDPVISNLVLPVARAVFLFGRENTLCQWRKRVFVQVSETKTEGFLPAGLFAQVNRS